jgi:Skp family chaperone for outer membrane proteins
MKTLLISAAFAAAVLAPAAASAQAVPPAVVAVVDLDRVSSQCNACKTAIAALQAQQTAFNNRRQALAAPLEAEGKSIQAAVDALPKGKQPDAALTARYKAFQEKQQSGADELQRQAEQIQRNEAYVNQQIQSKLNTIYTPVMQRRGANLLVDVRATLATSRSVDVTDDVLAALNAALPTIATTAPAQQLPQGR